MNKEDKVLDFLRSSRKGYVSGEEISKKLGVSRAAVWKDIQNLRSLGYEIEAEPHRGYQLTAIPDKMFADEISWQLPTKVIGRNVFSYDSLDSTNDAAFKLGKEGIKEGACVFAEYQKKGRGRLGRHWESSKGKNVLLSVLLRPVLSPSDVSKITLAAALSVARAARSLTGADLGIKWPNDLLFEGKKVGGILTEMDAEADRVHFVVIGIGVNVNESNKDLPSEATSLKEIAGKALSRLDFAKKLLIELEKDYSKFKSGSFDALAEEWENLSVTSGRRVTADVLGRKVHGQAVGIDKDGALWIRKDNGLQERIVAGDVTLLRQSHG